MTLLHQAAQKAVEQLKRLTDGRGGIAHFARTTEQAGTVRELIAALESALQQQPQQATEPAWGITPATLNRHVSPGITLGHELNRLRQYDAAALQHQEVPREPVAADAKSILEQVANAPNEENCAMCNGRGFYGIPGQRCSFCKGTGRVQWRSAPDAASPSTTRQQEVGSGWKPIESAPKDGSEMLLSNGQIVAQGWWEHQEPYIREHRDMDGRYIDQDDHDGYDGWLDFAGGMLPEPTHWMPLPAAPSTPENAGGVKEVVSQTPPPLGTDGGTPQ